MIPATAFAPACAATEAASRAIHLMDLTSLNDDDHDARIIALCHQAQTPVGNTAAVCIYPRFVGLARLTLAAQGTRPGAGARLQGVVRDAAAQGDHRIR